MSRLISTVVLTSDGSTLLTGKFAIVGSAASDVGHGSGTGVDLTVRVVAAWHAGLGA
jgi:hypothetical protein